MEFLIEEISERIFIKSKIYRSKEHFEDWLDSHKNEIEFKCPNCDVSKLVLNRPYKSFLLKDVISLIDSESLQKHGGFDETIKTDNNYSNPNDYAILSCSNCRKKYLMVFGQHEQWASCNLTKLKVIFEIE